MGCCGNSSPTSRSSAAPQRLKQCQDVFFLILMILCLGTCGYMWKASNRYFKPFNLNSDNFGNICGWDNTNSKYYAWDHEDIKSKFNEITDFNVTHTKMNFTSSSNYFDSKTADPNVLMGKKIPTNFLSLCLDKCPGSNMPESFYTDDNTLSIATAAFFSGTPVSKNSLKTKLVLTGFSSDDADKLSEDLWCDSVLARNNYDSSKLDYNICQEYPVLIPQTSYLKKCMYKKSFLSVFAKLYTQSQQVDVQVSENSNNSTSSESFLQTIIGKIEFAFEKSEREILVSFGISILMGLAVILIIQIATKYIIMVLVVAFFITALGAISVVWIKVIKLTDPNGKISKMFSKACTQMTDNNGTALEICDNDTTGLNDEQLAKLIYNSQVTAFIVTLIAGLVILTICCCWGNIRLAVTLFDEAGKAVFARLGMLIQPIFSLIIITLVFAVFIIVCNKFSQCAERFYYNSSSSVQFEAPSFVYRYLWIFGFFCGTWLWVAVDGINQTVLAGTVANWYFCRNKDSETNLVARLNLCPGLRTFCETIRYSLGSIAYGSFLIAVVKTVQLLVWLIQRQSKTTGADQNKVMEQLLKCAQCLLAFVERFLAFINRNAYIGIAIYGYDFCRSAMTVLSLKVENAGRSVVILSICTFTLTLGKLISVAGTLAFFHWYSSGKEYYQEYGNVEMLGLFIIIGIFAFIITTIFLSVYCIALDTIFICFCEDQRRNNGKDRPYFSSAGLQQFMLTNA